jgi:hypothetical protein
MPKIAFLGAHILHFDVRPQDTTWLLRIDIACDLTTPLAEKLHCEDILSIECAQRIPLTIEDLNLTELRMSCSGLEQHDLEMLAQRMGDFRVIRKEEEGVVERMLRFHIYAPADAVPLVAEYCKTIGQGKAKLTVNVLKQQKLDEEVEEEESEQAPFDAGEPGGKASRRQRVAPFVKRSEETAAQV